MKTLLAIALLFTATIVAACIHQHPGRDAASTKRTIALPAYQADLPDAPGREVFAVSCLSCHTPRYITMQPPTSAAKWEENVRKMIKTYGAPIAEEQVPQIVQYLMSTKEAHPKRSWIALAIVPKSQPTIVKPSHDPAVWVSDVQRGATLYAKSCASCHGSGGAGDGASATTMLPRPNDLTAARYTAEALCLAINSGVPATAMPAANLSDADLRALVSFTQELGEKPGPRPSTASTQAAALYVQYCANCHGDRGAADGPAAAASPRPPANFRLKQPDAAYAARIIADGVPGTTMPQWKTKFAEPQRKLLADYVRGFFADTDLSKK